MMKVLYIYDCVTGRIGVSRNFPVQVGSSPSCPLQVTMNGDAGLFMTGDSGLSFYVLKNTGDVAEVNGQQINNACPIVPDSEHLIVINDGIFMAYWTENEAAAQNMMGQYRLGRWFIYDISAGAWTGPYEQSAIAATSDASMGQRYTMAILAGSRRGLCTVRTLQRIIRTHAVGGQSVLGGGIVSPPPQAPPSVDNSEQEVQERGGSGDAIDDSVGQYTCPVCWLKFDIGDVMSIATHPDLMGDPVLGRDQMKRFLPENFNAAGQPLDEMGMPCSQVACPHCRCKLPPGFLESREHIFSIIGAPAAGKSYYLASLIHEMERYAMKRFEAAWRDADPAGNSMLNDVTYRLFNSYSPEEAYLSKTDLDGALYSEFLRHGRRVKLPRPFVYTISSLRDSQKTASLIFYDNAGEHFEPGRNSEDSPGARHVGVADGLFFLFDPTTSHEFRRMIGESDDPQLAPDAPRRMDQQNVIIAETAVRIATLLNLPPGQKIDKPLAVMIGKCDLWMDKLGSKLQSVYTDDGRLDSSKVDSNSEILRSFMLDLHPSLCATAETLSSRVRYFAISPLGCSPVKFTDPVSKSIKLGPDPMMISPRNVCEPTFWALSILEPDIIPTV